MDKKTFTQNYMVSFLASFAAQEYVANCQKGWPTKTQPVEDARLLAEEAWDQLAEQGMIGPNP